jgi:hypothetical protein
MPLKLAASDTRLQARAFAGSRAQPQNSRKSSRLHLRGISPPRRIIQAMRDIFEPPPNGPAPAKLYKPAHPTAPPEIKYPPTPCRVSPEGWQFNFRGSAGSADRPKG